MKRILFLILALIFIFFMYAGTAMAAGETFSYSMSYAVNGQPVSELTGLNVGDEITVTVALTRTDIAESETYEAWGLEIDINDYGMDYVSGTGFQCVYQGVSTTVKPSSYMVGGATGIGNIRFYRITSGEDKVFTLDRTISITAVYTVTDPANVQAYTPKPIVYLGGSATKVSDVEPEGNYTPVTPPEKAEINYILDGGTMEDASSIIVDVGSTITLPTPTKEGTTFAGWSDGSKTYPAGASYEVAGNVTLTAKWGTTPTPGPTPGPGPGPAPGPDDPAPQPGAEAEHIAYVKGYADGTIRPEANVTRAETATMLYRLLTPARRDEIFTAANDFTDVKPADWFNKAVSSMANGGYVSGYPDGTFGGGRTITRAEFTAMAVRFGGLTPAGTASFSDLSADNWAGGYIAAATQAGWINGYPDGTFRPNRAITRAEAIAVLNRALDRGVNAESQLGNYTKFADNADAGRWYYYEIIEAANDHTCTGKRPSETWTANKVDYVYDLAKYENP